MVKLIILFRAGERPAGYDQQYNEFLMKLESLPGVRKKAVNFVYAGPGGAAPFRSVVEIYFDDRPALDAALISPEGVESGNYLNAFAGADAIIMFSDVMEEAYEKSSSESTS